MRKTSIAVVVPSYKVKRHIISVLQDIGPEVDRIYVVDDCCPDKSGDFVESTCRDSRVIVLRHSENQGVGGAVITGYKAAVAAGSDIIVKIDGDGQMDPSLIPYFVAPLIAGQADYAKGNRFYNLEQIQVMPKLRLFGNAVLSFMTKISSGYWDLFDPTNGYTAVHRTVLLNISLNKVSRRYFFETDMLFRLNILRAVVVDIPMHARYLDEVSNLKVSRIAGEFLFKHMKNFFKRIFYNYYLRDMSIASIELPLGLVFFSFGCVFGLIQWTHSINSNVPSSAGTVMLSALPVIVGFQLILSFLGHDTRSVPLKPYHLLVKNHAIDTPKE